MSLTRRQLTLTPSSTSQKRKVRTGDNRAKPAGASFGMEDAMERLEVILKSEMATMRSELSTHMATMCSKIDALSGEQRTQKTILQRHDKRLDTVEQQLVELQDRSRRSNVRLVGLPEGLEKDDPVGFIKRSLPVWLPALKDENIEVERAHRIYANPSRGSSKTPRSKTPEQPRVFIFKLLRFNDRDMILQAARDQGGVQLEDETSLSLFPDYSPVTAKKRAAFKTVKKELRRKGYQFFLQYPAILKVTLKGGATEYFHTPEEASAFCDSLEDFLPIDVNDTE